MLPDLNPCSHDNCCFGAGGTDLVLIGFCRVELCNVAEICWSVLVKNAVHQGGDLEFNSCLHRQPVQAMQCRLDVRSAIQSEN